MPLKQHEDFMKPRAVQGTFIEYEDNEGTWFVPEENRFDIPDDVEITDEHHGKWFGRLSPDGCFIDSTDWTGPFDSEEQALWDLYETYGDNEDTFFHFIGEQHQILEDSLEIRSDGDHLWGVVLGEKTFKYDRLTHIAHSNGIGFQEYEDDDGNISVDEVTNINDEQWSWLLSDLQQNFNFNVPTGDEAVEYLKRIKAAQKTG